MDKLNLIKSLKFDDSDVCEEMQSLHPLQIISDDIEVPIWRIKYSYLTQRGNKKEATKYLFKDESCYDCIDNEFNLYIQRFNEEHQDRMLSNVEILDAEYIGKSYLHID
jgi:hypothetical protein